MQSKYRILLIMLLCFPIAVVAKTYDVSSCSEFRDALSQAGTGDTIQYGEGKFRCAFDTRHDGVIFQGVPGFKTRIIWSEGSSGRHIIGIKHDNITIQGLLIDGEKRNNSGHGLIRVGTSKGLRIRHNRIIDSGSAHINLGGSWKRTTVRDVEIIGNYLCGSGMVGEYGESIYVGQYQGKSSVDGVTIAGNEICRFTDNGIDLKPGVQNVKIYDNHFHDQGTDQGKEINTGTLVVQGRGIEFHDNYIDNVIPGKAVFNLVTNARVMIADNVIQTVRRAQSLVRSRGSGSGGKTEVISNIFCDTGGAKMQSVGGIAIADYIVSNSTDPCREPAQRILTAMKQYQEPGTDPPPPPVEDLPDLRIVNITYGEVADFAVRVYTAAVDPEADAQMDKREFREGSVLFYSVDSEKLTFYRQKQSPSPHPEGWAFYLSEPYPKAPIRMVAETSWITGAPAIDTVIPRWHTEPPRPDPEPDPEPLPILEMAPKQTATCQNPVTVGESSQHPIAIQASFCGRVNTGLRYRSVTVRPASSCFPSPSTRCARSPNQGSLRASVSRPP